MHNTTDIEHFSNKLDIFRVLNTEIPYDHNSLPTFLLRIDLIPDHFESLEIIEQQSTQQNAILYINYREGFPTLNDGTPLWNKLPHESDSFYSIFKLYRDSNNISKYEHKHKHKHVHENEYENEYENENETLFIDNSNITDECIVYKGMRSIHKLKTLNLEHYFPEIDEDTLLTLFEYYYWDVRCNAYDLFLSVENRKRTEARILSTNNSHFLKAEGLIQKAYNYLNSNECWDQMNPAIAATLFEKLTRVQRLATGQGMQAGATRNLSPNTDIKSIANAIRTQEQLSMATGISDSNGLIHAQAGIAALMEDPEALEKLQEVSLIAIEATQDSEKRVDEEDYDKRKRIHENKSGTERTLRARNIPHKNVDRKIDAINAKDVIDTSGEIND